MLAPSKEARIFLVIEAIRGNKKINYRKAIKTYNVPKPTLYTRINGRTSQRDYYNLAYRLTALEEEAII